MIVNLDLHRVDTIMIAGTVADLTIGVLLEETILLAEITLPEEETMLHHLVIAIRQTQGTWTVGGIMECVDRDMIHHHLEVHQDVTMNQCPHPEVTEVLDMVVMKEAEDHLVTMTVSEAHQCLRATDQLQIRISAVPQEAHRRGRKGVEILACEGQCHVMTVHQQRG